VEGGKSIFFGKSYHGRGQVSHLFVKISKYLPAQNSYFRSGVGKTSLIDQMAGFGCDLSPLARVYPILVGYVFFLP
jgi:hypothetical protein